MRLQALNIASRLLAAAALAGVLTAGCERQPPGQAQGPAAQRPAPEVAVVTVAPQSMVLTTELPGRTSAYRVADIRPQVNGLIQQRLFTEGAEVKAGAVLYQIDPAPFHAELANAMAALGRSEAGLPALRTRAERYRTLVDDSAISRQEVDDAAGALDQAEADVRFWQTAVDKARIQLAYTRITAPIAGRIGVSSVTEGAIVTAYQPMALATIQQLDPIYVDVPQSTAALLKLRRRLADGRLHENGLDQNSVRIVLGDGTAYPLTGRFQFRDVTVDPSTGSITLRIVVPNPQGLLLPGMFIRAVLTEGVQQEALMIPQQAVTRDARGNPMVLVVGGGNTAEVRHLALDRAIGSQWLVSSGLAPGDRVIAAGIQKVRPGTVVTTVPYVGDATTDAAGSPPRDPAAGKTS